jgi:uncharacterized protein (DUF4415 family)
MAGRPDPSLIDDDNPEWTEADFKAARPASEVLPPELYSKLMHHRTVSPPARLVEVKLHVEQDVLEAFQAGGPGWQGRMSDALKKVVSR